MGKRAEKVLGWVKTEDGYKTQCETFIAKRDGRLFVLRDKDDDFVGSKGRLTDVKAEAHDVINNRPHKCPECSEYVTALRDHHGHKLCTECIEAADNDAAMREYEDDYCTAFEGGD